MSCGKDAELLKEYLEADEQLAELMPKARTLVAGHKIELEVLDDERMRRIDAAEKRHDAAFIAWRTHTATGRLPLTAEQRGACCGYMERETCCQGALLDAKS